MREGKRLRLVGYDYSTGGASRPTALVSRMVTAIKGFSNRDVGQKLWPASFYDHVIRDEGDYRVKWEYIAANPDRWAEDEYYC